MYFATLTDFFYMGGHGIYVWSVYVVAVIILTTLVVTPYLDRRRFLREEAQRIRRDETSEGGGVGRRQHRPSQHPAQKQLPSTGA